MVFPYSVSLEDLYFLLRQQKLEKMYLSMTNITPGQLVSQDQRRHSKSTNPPQNILANDANPPHRTILDLLREKHQAKLSNVSSANCQPTAIKGTVILPKSRSLDSACRQSTAPNRDQPLKADPPPTKPKHPWHPTSVIITWVHKFW